ncbi:MAG: radical SAM family heme chaperone HemW [Fibromonadaceae bacterium]|nr:radical SAM family heme chaperone HemW [Fibromonadaceae bacterium]
MSLYIHVPFCASICNYCDFCAMPAPERVHNEYVDLILQELKTTRNFETIYIGGGSPSALSMGNLKKLLANLKTDGEFSMEWNPEEVSDEKIQLALDFGVNRFSLGVQSLNDDLLKMLGRRHSAKTALKAFEKLNRSFNTGSCDLMFCLPNQSTADFLNDVEALVSLNAKHISFYGLTLEKKTKLPPQPEDLYPEMYLKAAEFLESAGLHRYEISNFAMPNHESKHNLVYWKRGQYLGAGPSAHSYLNGIRYYVSGKYLPWKKWVLSGCPQNGLTQDIPSLEGKEIEAIWLSLRTKEGLSLKSYEHEFNKKFDLKKAEPFIKKGWLAVNEGYIRLNGEGFLWLDKLILKIF